MKIELKELDRAVAGSGQDVVWPKRERAQVHLGFDIAAVLAGFTPEGDERFLPGGRGDQLARPDFA